MTDACDYTDCDLTCPHHHTTTRNHYGALIDVTVYHAEDPRAEVRDPDTGEVIFPAVKGPLKVIQGGLDAITGKGG